MNDPEETANIIIFIWHEQPSNNKMQTNIWINVRKFEYFNNIENVQECIVGILEKLHAINK